MTESGKKNFGFQTGAELGEWLGTVEYEYHNYIVFSTLTQTRVGDDPTIAYGFLFMSFAKPISEWQ